MRLARGQLDIDGRAHGIDPKLRKPEKTNLATEYAAYVAGMSDPPKPDQFFGRETLSTSSLGTLLACEQRWQFARELRLEPAIKPVALEMGGAFAYAIEVGDADPLLNGPQAGYEQVMNNWREATARHGSNPWIFVPPERDALIMATTVRGAARAYIARYGVRELREHEMRVRIRNPITGRSSTTFDLACRTDGLDLDAGVLIEDKLVGQIPRDERKMARKLALDRQVSIETYCVWRTTGVMLGEVCYRMTLKPSIKQREGRASREGGRTGVEGLDAFLERLEAEYEARPDHYLAEIPCTRSADDFLRLEGELWEWADRVRRARRRGVWPRNTGACEDYGGCAFLAICSGEPGAEALYVERARR